MKIEIKLSEKEVIEILAKHFQPMFPDKIITGDVKSYGNAELEVSDKKEVASGEEQ